MKKSTFGMAGIAAIALTLAACGAAPEEEETAGGSEETSDGGSGVVEGFKACMVSDQGGWDDQSFNQSGFEGLERAADELGVEVNSVESTADADYGPNIDSLVQDGCTYIIGVGFLLEQAIQDAAVANPDLQFALIDSSLSDPGATEADPPVPVELDNVKPLLFNTAEAAFLAGYVAGSQTETGVVGTFGGLPIPSVNIFMDGFVDGVAQWNTDSGDDVQVLGWDKETQDGQFSGDFETQANGQNITQGFLNQNADIVMPVAGPVGLGAAAAAEGVEGTRIIWVDSDGFESTEYGDIILTSVVKEIGAAVFDSIDEASQGNFSSEPYVGTLENEGVALAPFHDFEDAVPADVVDRVAELREQIISGELVVESPNTP
ncbi:basic membrane lipoprotein [Beutenbergia cavernae DSM 12333]|uniref:Basic membrane lipoprotein n=1 Tax=Beutenbergia cavernae (strain ATCC BAA-8 / DSM 12333 / CCUG 43141 / JCM 11478 / NBRC 16432 / NCIMB 13614 / HKI 0122) TaxID=471853 RepID=C5BZ77_BEUC1|nr:BMP family ABC transporter substrate-binding protein [Beutenbergia cavernae]ACQ81192.1 basic membrane lipoprotein [Beutenbergia cavernae DSM 12333]